MKQTIVVFSVGLVVAWLGFVCGRSAGQDDETRFRDTFSVCVNDTVCETNFDRIQGLGIQAFIESVDLPEPKIVTLRNVRMKGYVVPELPAK